MHLDALRNLLNGAQQNSSAQTKIKPLNKNSYSALSNEIDSAL